MPSTSGSYILGAPKITPKREQKCDFAKGLLVGFPIRCGRPQVGARLQPAEAEIGADERGTPR